MYQYLYHQGHAGELGFHYITHGITEQDTETDTHAEGVAWNIYQRRERKFRDSGRKISLVTRIPHTQCHTPHFHSSSQNACSGARSYLYAVIKESAFRDVK